MFPDYFTITTWWIYCLLTFNKIEKNDNILTPANTVLLLLFFFNSLHFHPLHFPPGHREAACCSHKHEDKLTVSDENGRNNYHGTEVALMEKIKYKTHIHKIQQMKLHAKEGDNEHLQNN